MGRSPDAGAVRSPDSRTLEALAIRALYSGAPIGDGAAGGRPGAAPYVRGASAARPPGLPWRVLGRVPAGAPEEANRAALEALEGGATGLEFPPESAAWSEAGWARALQGVHPEGAALRFPAGERVAAAALDRAAGAAAVGADLGDWCLGADPLRAPEAECAAALQCARGGGARALLADAEPFHDAGADAALELGALLAATAHALRALGARAAPEEILRRTAWRLPMEREFFGGVVKLRAARQAWSALASACGGGAPPPQLHAVGSRRTLTRRDPHSNLVRATVQAAAAACGGADAWSAPGFDEACGGGSALGRRLARNVALVVEHEARLMDVLDPAGGSEHAAERTSALARAAWEEFRAIEAAGGLAAALADGSLRARLDAEWRRRAARLRSGEEALVGVNRHPGAAPDGSAAAAPPGPWGLPRRREEEACEEDEA